MDTIRSHPIPTGARPGLVVAALLALVVVLLPPPALAQQPAGFDIQLRPEDPNAVHASGAGDVLIVDGTVPQGTLQDTRIIGIDADGREVPQVVTSRDAANENYVRTDGTELSGRVTLNVCFGQDPNGFCPTPNSGVQRLFMQVTIDGVAGRGPDGGLPNDYVRPEILRFDIVAPDQIVAVFTEPVRFPPDTLLSRLDRPEDWTVDGGSIRVSRVENFCSAGSNELCDRRRLFTDTIPEDTTPRVRYQPGGAIGEQPSYIDAAANIINASDTPPGITGNNTAALDRVIPAIPQIDRVDGRTPSDGQVASNEPAPELALSNLNPDAAGQTLTLEVDGQVVQQGIAITGSTMTLQVPDLGADRAGIPIEVVAIDAAGNRSDSTEGSPQRDHGENNPVQYTLDTLAPRLVAASRTSSTQVQVSLSEAVTPAGDAGEWTVVEPDGTTHDAQASGSGASRTITIPGGTILSPSNQPIPPGSTIAWQGPGYADAAGNGMVEGAVDLVPPPPIAVPVVTEPTASPSYRQPPQQTIAGTATAGATQVELLDGGTVVQTAPVSDGRWSFQVEGQDGQRLDDYTVRARSDLGAVSAAVPVPTIVVDGTEPAVTVTSPSANPDAPPLQDDRHVVPQGTDVAVSWQVDEVNFDRLRIEAVYDDGDDGAATPDRAAEVLADDIRTTSGSRTFRLPADFEGQVTYRVVARDLADNSGRGDSHPILVHADVIGLIDGELVANPLEPASGSGARITATFTDAVSGATTGSQWRADDGLGEGQRSPLSARVQDGTQVVLDFAQPFPGDRQPAADPNAAPLFAYVGGGLIGLQDADGDDPISNLPVLAADVTDPELEVSTTDVGPTDLPDDQLTLTGRTDVSALDNTLIVSASSTGFAQQGPAQVLSQPVNGDFEVALPVPPDATTTFTIEVVDPAGNTATPHTIQVVEDSTAPTVTAMTATLIGSDAVIVPLTFSEVVSQVELAYDPGDAQFRTIETRTVGDSSTVFRWDDLPDDVDLQALRIRATATDVAGNVGPPRDVGISNLPELATATVLDEDTVRVTTTEPVTTDADRAAGFAIGGGPGVRTAVAEEGAITLSLADPLEAGTFEVRYNGQGGWVTQDGRPLRAGSVPLVLSDEVLFAVTGLAAGPSCDAAGAVISFIDDRNDPARVTGYEVTRDGEVIGTVAVDERVFTDTDVAEGPHTYGVTALGEDGARADERTVAVELGGSPVPDDAVIAALAGGTGAPGAAAPDDVRFTRAPNLGPDGGTVLSCDGSVAALVPAGVTGGSMYAALVPVTAPPADGFAAITAAHQLVAVRDGGFAAVDAFAGYVELSHRDLGAQLQDATTQRIAVLRPHADGGVVDEKAARVGRESVATHLMTLGTFAVVQADGASVRVFGPDPAVPADRFATAAGLSQTQFRSAASAVVARADDYPDALAAAPLAAQVGGPVLLSRTTDVPATTMAELARLGTGTAYLVGGTAALSEDVAAQLRAAGIEVVRVAGPTRFETAAEVARLVGSVEGGAFLATGSTFADALSASAPAAALGQPILLTTPDGVPTATRQALDDILAVDLHVIGGEAAIAGSVTADLDGQGFDVRRSAGATRYATAVALAQAVIADGDLDAVQPLMASGDGDGITSPDALAAGPIAGRLDSVLLLTPRSTLTQEVADFLAQADQLRGLYLAGGEAAVTADTRRAIDQAAAS